MAYSYSRKGVGQRGLKFDCKHLSYLRRYGLTGANTQREVEVVLPMLHLSTHIAQLRKFPQNITFVLAANERYYPSIRAVISSIQHTLGSYRKIILYDMGGIALNATIVSVPASPLIGGDGIRSLGRGVERCV